MKQRETGQKGDDREWRNNNNVYGFVFEMLMQFFGALNEMQVKNRGLANILFRPMPDWNMENEQN